MGNKRGGGRANWSRRRESRYAGRTSEVRRRQHLEDEWRELGRATLGEESTAPDDEPQPPTPEGT